MGIWDFISGTTDSIKSNAPDLTAVKNWCPTTDSVKRIVPDVTAAKNVCSTAYGYGSTAVTKVDSAVRGNLNHYLKDEEARSKLLQFAASIGKHTAHESLKALPGYKVFVRSIRDVNESGKQEVDVKALQADLHMLRKEFSEYRKLHESEVDVKALHDNILKLEKQVSENRKPHEQVLIDKPCADLKSPNTSYTHSVVNQKPEDVIGVFMMNEFMGRQFLDNLIGPRGAPKKK